MTPLIALAIVGLLARSCSSQPAQNESVITSSLGESLKAGVSSGALSGTVILQPSSYQPQSGLQPLDVDGPLIIVGAGKAAGGGPVGTTLDLSAYQDPAFRLLNGSSLVLSNLSLLLPPVPAESLAASPPSVLSHVVGGSPGRVVLEGVELVLAGRGELSVFAQRLCDPFAWRRNVGQLQLLNGTILYGNGTMPLSAANADTAAASTPPARLVRSSVTCSGGPPPPPWVCSATHVGDGAELRATAEALLASSSAFVLLSLAANVTLEPGSWSGSLEVPSGVYLGLYGSSEQGRTVQLDFGGLERVFWTDTGYVVLQGLTLLGLQYPADVGDIRDTVAVWVHAVYLVRPCKYCMGAPPPAERLRFIRCTLALSDGEAAYWNNAALAVAAGRSDSSEYLAKFWRLTPSTSANPSGANLAGAEGQPLRLRVSLLDSSSPQRIRLDDCVLVSLEESGAVASPLAAAAASTWPLGSTYDPDELRQLRLADVTLTIYSQLEDALANDCTAGKATTIVAPTEWPYYVTGNVPQRVGGGNATIVSTGSGSGTSVPGNAPCAFRGMPVSQTHRRTAWDAMGLPSRLYVPDTTPVTLEGLVMYNLPPAGPGYQPNYGPPPLVPPAYTNTGGSKSSGSQDSRAGANAIAGDASISSTINVNKAGARSGKTITIIGPGGVIITITPVSGSSSPPPRNSTSSAPMQPPSHPPSPAPSPPPPKPPSPSPPPMKPPSPPSPTPPAPTREGLLDSALASMALPLWTFWLNRSSEVPILRLRRVTLVVPPAELALLLRLLGSAARLPASTPKSSPPPFSTVGNGERRRNTEASSSHQSSGIPGRTVRRSSRALLDVSGGDVQSADPPAQGLPCLHSVLLRFAATAEVAWYTDTTISFTSLSFHGWSGRDVVVTSDFPPDAPTLRMAPAADLSPGLEAACPPPPPSRPAPASPPPPQTLPSGPVPDSASRAQEEQTTEKQGQHSPGYPLSDHLPPLLLPPSVSASRRDGSTREVIAVAVAVPLGVLLLAAVAGATAFVLVLRHRRQRVEAEAGVRTQGVSAGPGVAGQQDPSRKLLACSGSRLLLSYVSEREAGLLNASAGSHNGGCGQGSASERGGGPDANVPRFLHLTPGGRVRRVAGPASTGNSLARAIENCRQTNDPHGDEVQLMAVLGVGSYGTVHLGLWRGLAIAVKVLVVHDTLVGTEGRRRQRAVLEAAIGTALDHPNVVATFAYDVRPLGEQPCPSVRRSLETTPSVNESKGAAVSEEVGKTLTTGSLLRALAPSAQAQDDDSPTPDVYQLYILQEFCSGGSVKEALTNELSALRGGLLSGGPSAAAAVLHLAFQVAAGLRHVHAAGIVHGDVSAGNVLLARREEPQRQLAPGAKDGRGDPDMERQDGDGDAASRDPAEASWRSRLARATHGSPPPVVAKVADFGLSLRLTGSRTHASGMHQGTPVYAAPEVIRDGRVSRASDVYSFGVLLLELFLGRPAAELWEAAAAAAAQRNSSHPQSGESHPLLAVLDAVLPAAGGIAWFPPQLRLLAADCLSANPSDRPTFDQVADALVGAIEAIA